MVESNWVPPPDGGPPSGGCPIHGLPQLVGISDRLISNVVGVRWGYTDRAIVTPIQVLQTGAIVVQ